MSVTDRPSFNGDASEPAPACDRTPEPAQGHTGAVNRIRSWIDAKPHRPTLAAIVLIETPLLAPVGIALTPGVIPAVTVASLVAVAWILLAFAALGVDR